LVAFDTVFTRFAFLTLKGHYAIYAISIDCFWILYYSVQTYLLVLLNVFTFIIIALLSFNLLKHRSMDDSEHLNDILESLKTTDESIATIEAMINRELKRIEHY